MFTKVSSLSSYINERINEEIPVSDNILDGILLIFVQNLAFSTLAISLLRSTFNKFDLAFGSSNVEMHTAIYVKAIG